MKKIVQLAVLASVVVSQGALSGVKVIYGKDHRIEVYEASPFQKKLAESAASMVPINQITPNKARPGFVQLNQTTLKEWLEGLMSGGASAPKLFSAKSLVLAPGLSFCPSERFVDQPKPATCSGFLIAPDLIVTAGHCVQEKNFCSNNRWVFGFTVDAKTKKAGVEINQEDVYNCKKVVSNTLLNSIDLDYAVVQLDRRVKGRSPLEIRNDGKVDNNAGLFVIGSPSGLPLKVAGGATVRENVHPLFFNANLDTFQGNSGSAVFNESTGIVEGILVRGETDFVKRKPFNNFFEECIGSNKCENDKCRGEGVTRLTAVPEIGIQKVLNEAAFTGDMEVLEKLLELNTWVDFYSKDGQTALMKASQGGKNNAAQAIIAQGADVNLQDALGNTALHYLAKTLKSAGSDLLTTLIAAGAKLEIKNNDGQTPLSLAAKDFNIEGVRMLIALSADKNVIDNKGETILFPFTRAGKTKEVKKLIFSDGVNPGVLNTTGVSVTQLKNAKGYPILKKVIRKLNRQARN